MDGFFFFFFKSFSFDYSTWFKKLKKSREIRGFLGREIFESMLRYLRRGNGVTAPGPGTITSYSPPNLHSPQQRLSDYTAKVVPLPGGITARVW